jgi:hypothetical protein
MGKTMSILGMIWKIIWRVLKNLTTSIRYTLRDNFQWYLAVLRSNFLIFYKHRETNYFFNQVADGILGIGVNTDCNIFILLLKCSIFGATIDCSVLYGGS